MTSIVVIGEDELCCALGERLVAHCLPGWQMPHGAINTRGGSKLQANMARYHNQLARKYPVLCIADTDGGCALRMRRSWVPGPVQDKNFCLRFAVNEADAWVLADRAGIADAFGIGLANVPREPESLVDAKREVLRLAHKSTKRAIKNEVVSADPSKPGTGYNLHLCAFVRSTWRVDNAAQHSPSLARAELALKRMFS